MERCAADEALIKQLAEEQPETLVICISSTLFEEKVNGMPWQTNKSSVLQSQQEQRRLCVIKFKLDDQTPVCTVAAALS